jgi:hypothetical protein
MSGELALVDMKLSWSASRPGMTALLRRVSGGGWVEFGRTSSEEMLVRGLDPFAATIFAAAAVLEDGRLAPEAEWQTLRVVPLEGPDAPPLPSAPVRFAAAQDGTQVNFAWAAADGATRTYEVRYGASWEDGLLVAADLVATSLSWPWRSSGETTFFVKAFDRFNRPSRQAASATVAIAALGTHVTHGEDDHAGADWPGDKEHLELDGDALRLERLPPFGAMDDVPFGSLLEVPCFARYWPRGVYVTPIVDVGQKEPQRVEIGAPGISQPIDEELPFGAVRRFAVRPRRAPDGSYLSGRRRGFAARNSWRTTALDPIDCHIEIDTSPTADGAWDGWRPYVPGVYEFWRTRIRVTVVGDGLRFVHVPTLVVRRRKLNLKDEGRVDLPGGGPVEVEYASPFTEEPQTTAVLVGSWPSVVRVELTPIDKTKFEIEAFDALDDSVVAAIHWHALGV